MNTYADRMTWDSNPGTVINLSRHQKSRISNISAQIEGSEALNSTLIQFIDPKQCQPLHEVRYEPKMMRLVKRMDEEGWKGKPLLVIERAIGTYRAITGTHRLQAAEIQGLLVPAVVLPSNDVTNSLTTGKDKRRLAIVESKEFENEIGNPDLVKLAREIMRKEVQHNMEGW